MSTDASATHRAKVALVWRGDRDAREKARAGAGRMGSLFDAMAAQGLEAEPCVYLDEMVDDVRAQLLGVDGVLVWVNPVDAQGDRSQLDALLREVAEAGVWVSAHPDTILRMGTKRVLYDTRTLGWGTDCDVYESAAELRERLPARLATGDTRVLKQYRGNGGLGVYRIALTEPLASGADVGDATLVHTQHARFGSAPRDMPLGDFLGRMDKHFAEGGCLIDQRYQERLADGMIRAYMVHDEVAGYGQQLIKALLPPPAEGPTSQAAMPGPRNMHGADAPEFARLRTLLESEWIPAMQELLDIPAERLPAIWDADFLYGPRTAEGEDSYVLCEINVSAVFPFPEHALPKLAEATARSIAARKAAARA